ncbi:hypothetical protein LEP3755_56100 [Leptolyngbya sp. NIES-3755]|nr:hypothetical protein LEP3755_56100 [Leptolyngbya sp. NIES-3755]
MDTLFHWVVLLRDVPTADVKAGDRAVIVDLLSPASTEQKAGYTIEVFRQGETVDVVSVPVSWVRVLPETWGQREISMIEVS